MRKLLSKLNKAVKDFDLIQENDFIAIGLSGGKDSLALCKILREYQKYSKINFRLCAICVDISNGENDFSQLQNFCQEIGLEFFVAKSEIMHIVFDIRKEKNPCSLCANLRRGILNSFAKNLGANKVALAHHNEDFVNTFLLSLLYEGRINSFKPSTYLSCTDLTVIRPFVYVHEQEIKNFTKDFCIQKNPCPVNHQTKREEMYEVVKVLKTFQPNICERITSALLEKK